MSRPLYVYINVNRTWVGAIRQHGLARPAEAVLGAILCVGVSVSRNGDHEGIGGLQSQ